MIEVPIMFSEPMLGPIGDGTKTVSRRIVNLETLRVVIPKHIVSEAPKHKRPAQLDAGTYNATLNSTGMVFANGRWDLKPCEFYFKCRFAPISSTNLSRAAYGRDGSIRKVWTITPTEETRLWVKETWRVFGGREYEYQKDQRSVIYQADVGAQNGNDGWRNKLFMPRWAARYVLDLHMVTLERVQDIDENDARLEGMPIDNEPCDHTRLSCEEIGCMGQTRKSSFVDQWERINGEGSWESNPWVWRLYFTKGLLPEAIG